MHMHRTFISPSQVALAYGVNLTRAFHRAATCQRVYFPPYHPSEELKSKESSFPRKTSTPSSITWSRSSDLKGKNLVEGKLKKFESTKSTKVQERSQSTMASNAPDPTDTYASAFSTNTQWRDSMAKSHPELFERMSKGQSPQILWIGCSDSRCPETTILGLQPGDVFVHRNIANIITATDLNSLSVIQYAVQYLKVKHVVLCGHTSCGGVAAALGNKKLGLIDTWLMPLRTLRWENLKLLEGMEEKERGLKLVELNVRKGVEVLTENPVVLDAINERGLKVHGLIYDVGSGELKELDTEASEEMVKGRTTAFKIEK